jgi:photosystem II oxygen-evolving enhancer protein 2
VQAVQLSSTCGSLRGLSVRAPQGSAPQSAVLPLKHVVVCCAAESEKDKVAGACNRRSAMWLAAVAAAGISAAQPAHAAYGEKANIFGSAPKTLGYTTLSEEGFTLAVPSTWNPSKEEDFDNVALRYEDNADATSHVVVIKQPATGKSSITDYGPPEKFMNDFAYLLGEQTSLQSGNRSEGGFSNDRVSAANLLQADVKKDGNNTYYKLEVLTRTADGTMGGRHQLISASVKDGQLYMCKVSVGDKRWFRGPVAKQAKNTVSSFSVA